MEVDANNVDNLFKMEYHIDLLVAVDNCESLSTDWGPMKPISLDSTG